MPNKTEVSSARILVSALRPRSELSETLTARGHLAAAISARLPPEVPSIRRKSAERNAGAGEVAARCWCGRVRAVGQTRPQGCSRDRNRTQCNEGHPLPTAGREWGLTFLFLGSLPMFLWCSQATGRDHPRCSFLIRSPLCLRM